VTVTVIDGALPCGICSVNPVAVSVRWGNGVVARAHDPLSRVAAVHGQQRAPSGAAELYVMVKVVDDPFSSV
jgi:hypothetical protein